MGEYVTGVHSIRGNMVYLTDGRAYANFILRGVNINYYDEQILTVGQTTNDLLFSKLSLIPSTDFTLYGLKATTSPDTVLQRTLQGNPDIGLAVKNGVNLETLLKSTTLLTTFFENKPELRAELEELRSRCDPYDIGDLTEYQRIYWLSIECPMWKSPVEVIQEKFFVLDRNKNWTSQRIQKFNTHILSVIPKQFHATPVKPSSILWAFTRGVSRGVIPPYAENLLTPTSIPNGKSFPEVRVNKTTALEAFYDHTEENPPKLADKNLRQRFENLSHVKHITVTQPGQSSVILPNGVTSYQSVIGISAYPTTDTINLHDLTGLCDQSIGVDADWCVRWNYVREQNGRQHRKQVLKNLDSENRANSTDVMDEQEYEDRASELFRLHESLKKLGTVQMRVATLLGFGSTSQHDLHTQVTAVTHHLQGLDYNPCFLTGNQFEAWKQMFPCVPIHTITQDLKQDTTSRLFSASIPLREVKTGDGRGLLLGVSRENDLGSHVYYDTGRATETGSGSITISGIQGSGKSNTMKRIYVFNEMNTIGGDVIDRSPSGEYAVLAAALKNTTVTVHVINSEYDLNPLTVLSHAPAVAGDTLKTLVCSILDFPDSSLEADILGQILSFEYRGSKKSMGAPIVSLWDVIRELRSRSEARELSRKLVSLSKYSFTDALFPKTDVTGKIIPKPVLPLLGKSIVYRTHKLTLPLVQTRAWEELSLQERWGYSMYDLISLYTEHKFTTVKDPFFLFCDEAHYLEASPLGKRLIEQQERQGRKLKKSLVVASQLPTDLGANDDKSNPYVLIPRKLVLKQLDVRQTVAGFNYISVPPTESLVREMTHDTSPLDPNRNDRVIPGREGEGWYSDGKGGVCRIKTLDHLQAAHRVLANTNSSSMIWEQ